MYKETFPAGHMRLRGSPFPPSGSLPEGWGTEAPVAGTPHKISNDMCLISSFLLTLRTKLQTICSIILARDWNGLSKY